MYGDKNQRQGNLLTERKKREKNGTDKEMLG